MHKTGCSGETSLVLCRTYLSHYKAEALNPECYRCCQQLHSGRHRISVGMTIVTLHLIRYSTSSSACNTHFSHGHFREGARCSRTDGSRSVSCFLGCMHLCSAIMSGWLRLLIGKALTQFSWLCHVPSHTNSANAIPKKV